MRTGPPGATAPGRASFLRHWLPVLAYTVFIFSLSTAQTPGPTFIRLQDKLLHFLVYAGYGLVLGRALRAALEGRGGLSWPLGAVLAGSLVGALDELYQRTVPGRSSDFRDWIADTAGLIAAALAMRLALGRLPARRPGPPGPSGPTPTPTGAAP